MSTATIEIGSVIQDTKTTGLTSYSGTTKVSQTLALTGLTKVYATDVSASSVQTYDLTSGLTDAYGTALVFTSLQGVVIQNTSATATITVGGGTNPVFGTDQYTVKAGATLPITSTFPVDSTHKVIRITPSAAATFSVAFLGT